MTGTTQRKALEQMTRYELIQYASKYTHPSVFPRILKWTNDTIIRYIEDAEEDDFTRPASTEKTLHTDGN